MTADSFPQQTVVVVPAHNERAHLPKCLRALTTAALCLPTPALIVVVLDSCSDDSETLAGQFGPDVHFVSIEAGNVGAARAAGFEYSKSLCADVEAEDTWYATTDADSVVDADWLTRMVAAGRDGMDMVLGVVRVSSWRHFSPAVMRRYLKAYNSTGPGHNHVHGANMGFRARAYSGVGGFRALATGEDVELVERFEAAGLSIDRNRHLSVVTSARPEGRAPGGFAQHLTGLSRSARKGRAGAA